MKISEVCEKTGLTKRTVRFYIEKGLLSPETEYKNGKDFREFSEADVRLLKAISVLRGLDISVDDIGRLIGREVSAGQLIEKYRTDSRTQLLDRERIFNILSEVRPDEPDDIYSFSEAVEKLGSESRSSHKDSEPDFSVLEDLTADEKRQAFERFHNELVKKNAVSDYKAKVLKRILILFAAAAAVFLVVCGLSWIPKSIEVTVRGYTYSEETGMKYEDTLTVKGKIYQPLFFMHTFSGEVSLENTPELNYTVSRRVMLRSSEDNYSQSIDEPYIKVYSDSVWYYLSITDPDKPNTTMMIEGFDPGQKMSYVCKTWDENYDLIYDYVFEEN